MTKETKAEMVVSVRMPADLKKALDDLADADGRKTSNYIKRVLEQHVREKGPKPSKARK